MSPVDSTVDPNPPPSPCSFLEYLEACEPRLDDSMASEVLQELKVPEKLARQVESEIRFAWEETRLSSDHAADEHVLQQAYSLAREIASRALWDHSEDVGRLPGRVMRDSLRRRAGRESGER